jgi:hypothetical protein
MYKIILPLAALTLAACSNPSQEGASDETIATSSAFMAALSSLCGNSYKGKVVSDDPQDADWRAVDLIVGPVGCADDGTVKMPLAVGEDTSRTWFLYPKDDAIEFRHQHLLKDGSVDPVSDYGGYAANLKKDESVWSVDFPADPKTVEIFKATGLDVSITNVWSMMYRPNAQFVYELNRENRHFRAEFDLGATYEDE